jgi:DedD protein
MGLFSLLRKNKQEKSTSGDSGFYSRSEEESKAVRSRAKRKQGNQAAEPVDPVLPQKKRARRRLVGALALVLAVVVGLPMILDSEPKPLAEDIAVQIPSMNKPAAPSSSRQSGASASSSRVAASASLDQKEEVMEVAPAASSGAEPVPAATPNAGASKDEHKPAEMAKPVTAEKAPVSLPPPAKSESKPEHAQAAKAAAPSVDKADDAARAKAILEGRANTKANPAPTTPEKKPGKFTVQVAALATQEKIHELQTRLKDAGIQSYTQKVATESGDRTRIRVGPFGNKEEAEKMRARLNKLGMNGTVVPPAN